MVAVIAWRRVIAGGRDGRGRCSAAGIAATMVVAMAVMPPRLIVARMRSRRRARQSGCSHRLLANAEALDEQRGDENKGHWAFHLVSLADRMSIRCGASIDAQHLSAG